MYANAPSIVNAFSQAETAKPYRACIMIVRDIRKWNSSARRVLARRKSRNGSVFAAAASSSSSQLLIDCDKCSLAQPRRKNGFLIEAHCGRLLLRGELNKLARASHSSIGLTHYYRGPLRKHARQLIIMLLCALSSYFRDDRTLLG